MHININNHTLDYTYANNKLRMGSYTRHNITMRSNRFYTLSSKSSIRCDLTTLEHFIINQRDLNGASMLTRRKRNLEERYMDNIMAGD